MSQIDAQSMQDLYNDWLAHPVTVRLRRLLLQNRESLKEAWASASFSAETTEKTALLSANALGQCEVLQTILNLELEQIFQEPSND